MSYTELGGSRFRLAEAIAALSLATDLGMGQPMDHSLRRCLLAVRLGQSLGLGDHELTDVYYVALVCSVGCTIKLQQFASWFQDEITAASHAATLDPDERLDVAMFVLHHVGQGDPALLRAQKMMFALVSGAHEVHQSFVACHEICKTFGEMLGFGPSIQNSLGQMHERWDGRGEPARLKREEKALAARIAHIAGDVEILYRLGGIEAAIAVVKKRSGKAYDPRVAQRFCQEAPRLLADINADPIWETVLAAEPAPLHWISEVQLDTIAQAMAHFADVKSPYTVGHSTGVAALVETAARSLGLSETEVAALRRAAWLHDLGRIGVPVGIWNKPGTLTQAEWERVRTHPYLTERVLVRSNAFGQLASLAALHHERLDGSGYHRGVSAPVIPTPARLLAAADFFHTKVEPRPHRSALTLEAAADSTQREIVAGRLDREATNAVLSAAGQPGHPRLARLPAGLTDREVEVLRLVAHGSSNREIGEVLYVSPKTVDHHIQHIYDKIGVSTRVAATLFAMRHDLISTSTI